MHLLNIVMLTIDHMITGNVWRDSQSGKPTKKKTTPGLWSFSTSQHFVLVLKPSASLFSSTPILFYFQQQQVAILSLKSFDETMLHCFPWLAGEHRCMCCSN